MYTVGKLRPPFSVTTQAAITPLKQDIKPFQELIQPCLQMNSIVEIS